MSRVLLVPGRGVPRPEHWLNRWLRAHPEYHWVSRGDDPGFDLGLRVAALRKAVEADTTPAILVAHSGGCITVVAWAAANSGPVRGALLVAAPYADGWQPSPDAGHIATADGFGSWPAGERLLAELQ